MPRAAGRKRDAERFFGRCRVSASVRRSGVPQGRQNQACMMCSIGKRVAQTCAQSAIFRLGVQGTKSEVDKIRKGELCACAFELTLSGDSTAFCDTKLLVHGSGCPRIARVGAR